MKKLEKNMENKKALVKKVTEKKDETDRLIMNILLQPSDEWDFEELKNLFEISNSLEFMKSFIFSQKQIPAKSRKKS